MKGRFTAMLAVLALGVALRCACAYAGSGAIHACVDQWGYVHVLLGSLHSCNTGWTALTWNAAGDRGPQPQPLHALHLNSGIPFAAGSQVQIQVLFCDERCLC